MGQGNGDIIVNETNPDRLAISVVKSAAKTTAQIRIVDAQTSEHRRKREKEFSKRSNNASHPSLEAMDSTVEFQLGRHHGRW